MPVKKTTTKKAPIKKTVAKKTTTKFATKKVDIKKHAVIVETKNTNSCVLKNDKVMRLLFVILLLGNLVFGILNFMKQDSALKLEEMKVGGSENFEKVMQLYNSDFYKEQQSAAIQQFMGQANQPAQQQAAPQIENPTPAE